jgi:hypothetical protein
MPSAERLTGARGALTVTADRRTTRVMKHVPESHQSIAPDLGVTLILISIAVVMAIVWVVVSLAK